MRVDPALVPKKKLATGQEIPCVGMGTFGSDHASPARVSAAVAGAIRCGYRLFDCAAVYGNEAEIGGVFADAFGEGVVTREELFITSKVWNDMHGEVMKSMKKTLEELRLTYVDAFFVHWPFPNYHAPGAAHDARNPDSRPFSADEFMATWRQMEELYERGLAKCIGMSNMTVVKLEAVLPLCRIKPALIEMELHPSFQQPALFDYCVERGIQPIGFSPVGSPARPDRDKTADDVVDTAIPELVDIARAHGVHPAIVCLKWAVQRGQIPIPFSVSEAHYVENLRAVTVDPLTDAEMATLATVDQDCRLIKGQVFLWEGAGGWEEIWDGRG